MVQWTLWCTLHGAQVVRQLQNCFPAATIQKLVRIELLFETSLKVILRLWWVKSGLVRSVHTRGRDDVWTCCALGMFLLQINTSKGDQLLSCNLPSALLAVLSAFNPRDRYRWKNNRFSCSIYVFFMASYWSNSLWKVLCKVPPFPTRIYQHPASATI